MDEEKGGGEGGGGGGGGDGYKGRRHLVSPRGVSVCPERGCMIDQREEGKNQFGVSLFSSQFPWQFAVAWCLFMSLTGPPFQIKWKECVLVFFFFLGGDVGQSAAAGAGNAWVFKMNAHSPSL